MAKPQYAPPPSWEDLAAAEPPRDDLLEQEVLGSLFGWFYVDSVEYRAIALPLLRPDDFYQPHHQAIYRAVLELSAVERPVDLSTVRGWLADRGQLEDAGGQDYLYGLGSTAITCSAMAPHHCRRLRRLAAQRRLIAASQRSMSEASDAAADPGQLGQGVLAAVEDLRAAGGASDLAPVADGWAAEPATHAEWQAARAGARVSTGLVDLDKTLLGGLVPGELIVVGARPGVGKSALALGLARAALRQGLAVAYFSYEMGEESLRDRLVAMTCELNGGDIRAGKLDPLQFASYQEAAGRLARLPLYVQDRGRMDAGAVRAACQGLAAGGKLGLVVLDYLQMMPGKPDRQTDASWLEGLCNGLGRMAKDLRAPVLALSQLNRGVEDRSNKKPGMADLRSSGGIEQAADVILLLHREDYYEDAAGAKPVSVSAEINVAKHRNGPTDRIHVLYHPPYTRFVSASREDQA